MGKSSKEMMKFVLFFLLLFLVGCTKNQDNRSCIKPSIGKPYGDDCYYCLNGEEIIFDCSDITYPSLFGENLIAKRKREDSTVIVEFNPQGIVDSIALPFTKASRMIICERNILIAANGDLYLIDFDNKSYELEQEGFFDSTDNGYLTLGNFPCANKEGKASFSYRKSLYIYDYITNELYKVDYLPNDSPLFWNSRESNFSSDGKKLLYVKNNSIYLFDVQNKSTEIIYTLQKPKREIIRAYFIGASTDTIKVSYSNTTDEKLFMKAWKLLIDKNGTIIEGRLK